MRVTAPPFHVYCRSTTVPYFDDDFDIGERAARDENGKTYYVPDDMSYKEWKETFVDGRDKSGFEVVDDGTKLTDEEIDKQIAALRKKQSELSGGMTYKDIINDFGSLEDYFEDDEKELYLKYKTEIEQLNSQKSTPEVMINGQLPEKSMNIEKALKNANPNYSSDYSYQVNCQRCVQTYELRRRGYDVEALPKAAESDTIIWGNECFVDSNGETPSFIYNQSEKNIKDTLANAPDVSRHIIYAGWKGKKGGAHVFIAEKENGVVRYVDPQTNDDNVERYFSLAKDYNYGILRIDDKDITTDVSKLRATVR